MNDILKKLRLKTPHKFLCINAPADLKTVLEKHPTEKAIFEALSFSTRREYVEWVITAKQEQTRAARLEGAIEKLGKGWKNPAGR